MSIIKEFLHEGGIYYHTFSTINDSVTLWDFNNKPLLHFDNRARPVDVRNYPEPRKLNYDRDVPGERLGEFQWGEQYLSFKYNDGTVVESAISVHKGDGLLDFEVIISRRWISENIPLDQPVDYDPDVMFKSVPETVPDIVIKDITGMLSATFKGGPVKQYMDKKRAKKRSRRYGF